MLRQLINIIIWIVVGIFAILLIFQLWIKRDPKRTIPKGDKIVAPSDGQIIQVMEIQAGKVERNGVTSHKIHELTKDTITEGYLITILTYPSNVHMTRAPIDGVILKNSYHKGKHKLGNNFTSTIGNTRKEILIQGKLKVKVIMVVGFLAGGIRSFIKVGQTVQKGKRIGRIVLESQTHLVLPKTVKLKVKERDKVYAGQTVIATY